MIVSPPNSPEVYPDPAVILPNPFDPGHYFDNNIPEADICRRTFSVDGETFGFMGDAFGDSGPYASCWGHSALADNECLRIRI